MYLIDLARFDAFALDLDGVVTRTAVVHAAAWKRSFDELLERLAAGRTWAPFDVESEYRGKHPDLDFSHVESMEPAQVDFAELEAFVTEGGLGGGQ